MTKKISELSAATEPLAGSELLEVVQGGTSKKVTAAGLITDPLLTPRALIGAGTFDANKLSGDDEHILEITNDPSLIAGGTSGWGKQLLRINSYGVDAYGNNVHWCRYRGTEASPTAVGINDYFQSFGYRGCDGSVALSQSAAAFQVQATENWAAGAHGIKFAFEVTPAGSTTRSRVVEIDSTGVVITGAVKPSVKTGQAFDLTVAASDEGTALTTGTGKVSFRMPAGVTLSDVRASLGVAQTSGSILTVDVNESGSSILSTKLTIDNTEKTSTTAATARVISDANLADDSEITIDIDQVGDGTAKGLKVTFIGVYA